VRVPVPRGAPSVEISDPEGNAATWPAAGDVAEVPITRVGFYTVGAGKSATDTTVAANLGDAVESSAAFAPTLTLGGRALRPPDPPSGGGARPLALLALLAAAGILLVEWWTYHRRWTV
jgi:hypothetical protein